MKRIVSSLVVSSLFLSHASLNAQTIERSQVYLANLGAPLPVSPYGKTSYPYYPTAYPWHSLLKPWGYGSPVGVVIPSIAFGVDDDKGAPRSCQNNTFNKHLGTDYAGPAGMYVYAIADGTVKRVGGFTGIGDYYVVVESGYNEKWTTLYGHLNPSTVALSKVVRKGDLIGTLYNYQEGGDIPHLHLGIRLSPYANVLSSNKDSSTRGFACLENPEYQLNKFKFTSPDQLRFLTNYY